MRATQAALEAETDEATYASPNRVKNSPGVAKAFCVIADIGTLNAGSYNVTSVTDVDIGNRTIVWNVDFADTSYACVGGIAEQASGIFDYNTFAVGSVSHLTRSDAGVLTDRASSTVAFGDQ